ncbi:MAG: hypothetical protein K0Q79_462 [Flavipsychrobacter sp.]|jgi:putative membrane protein|nr:hypothetical protein [Flavipsychrobacter sp.]
MLLNKRIPLSYTLKDVKYDLLIITCVALGTHYIAATFDHIVPEMPPYIPTLLGTSISILLSFKMNQSYDRWWEARKIWGSIVNDSRTFVIQLESLTHGHNKEQIKTIAYRQIAFCYALGDVLRGLAPAESISKFVDDKDMQEVLAQRNIPLALLNLNARDIKVMHFENKQMDVYSHLQLDSTIVRLVDAMGRAERIKSTIFPASYRIFLHYAVYVFVITLSLALNTIDTLFEIPLLVTISSVFFLVDKSANNIQDPFGNSPSDTAMTAIARNIEINIRQLLGEKEVPNPTAPESFYLM